MLIGRVVVLVFGLVLLAGCQSGRTAGTSPAARDLSVAAIATSTGASPAGTTAHGPSTSPVPGRVLLPPVAGRFDYQIGGAYPPERPVSIVDRDRTESAVPGRYNICYLNAFQSQPEAKSFWVDRHPDLLLRNDGGYLQDPDWPGEIVLDTSTPAHRAELAGVLDDWVDGCADKGFQAIEPDNLDSWTRSGGRLTAADNLALATVMVMHAHARGLAVAQKNGSDLGSAGRTQAHFDFAIAEDCQAYSECPAYTDVYPGEVIEIEYTDQSRSAYQAACAARSGQVSVIRRDRAVAPAGQPGYHYEWC